MIPINQPVFQWKVRDPGFFGFRGDSHGIHMGFNKAYWEALFAAWEDAGDFFFGRKKVTRWWFQIFFICTPNFGEMIQFDEHIFQMGWTTN